MYLSGVLGSTLTLARFGSWGSVLAAPCRRVTTTGTPSMLVDVRAEWLRCTLADDGRSCTWLTMRAWNCVRPWNTYGRRPLPRRSSSDGFLSGFASGCIKLEQL